MRILFSIILGAGLYLPLSVLAGDLEAGKSKAEASCVVCHGLDGQATIPLAAHLSGQQKDYLVIQLRDYRSGKRQHDQMSIIAKPLTNEEIDNLAEWYSSIKVMVDMPEDSTNAESKDKPEEAVFNSESVKKIEQQMQELIK